jgi:hypothetical protein
MTAAIWSDAAENALLLQYTQSPLDRRDRASAILRKAIVCRMIVLHYEGDNFLI